MFRLDGREQLRPVVEFNARFTMGIVAVGLLRRALEQVRGPLELTSGERRAFLLTIDAPAGGWESSGLDDDVLRLPLAPPGASLQPALLFAREAAALDAALPEGAT